MINNYSEYCLLPTGIQNNEGSISKTNAEPTKDGELQERGNWGSQMQFVMACLGYAIGLGNVWRFPYLCYRNGGGAFLVPFLLMMLVIGLPIFFLEMVVGQYSGFGPTKAFSRLIPAFHGVGYAVITVITLVTIYYMVIVAWIIFYIFASFTSELKWGSCLNDFNTLNCYSGLNEQACVDKNGPSYTFFNKTCMPVAAICEANSLPFFNNTHCGSAAINYSSINEVINRTLGAEEYYFNYVLRNQDATWDSWGFPSWELTLCLALAWILAFLCLIKGINNAGIVIYITVITPYVVLVALLVRGLTLEGSTNGIMFYITPDFSTLTNINVWGDAASQIFYSFGIACGSLVTLASYNKFNNNCHKDAVFVSITNVLTAIFAGFVIFSITGFLAHEMGVDVSQVADEGPGLAFVAYPEAVLRMPLPQLWSVLFFGMMLMLGLSSQFAGIEAINTAIIDRWPHLRAHRWKVTLGTCVTCFLLALPMISNGGVYLFTLMDWNTASWAILLIGMFEIIQVSWFYGIKRFLDNIADMEMKLSIFSQWYWRITLVVVSPLVCFALFLFLMIEYEVAEVNGYEFPVWADAIGILIGCTTLAPIPLFFIYRAFIKRKPTGWALLKPTESWAPQSDNVLTKKIKKSDMDSKENSIEKISIRAES